MSSYKKVIAIAAAMTVIGITAVLIHYQKISGRQGTIVIPAGNTYLGPTVQTVKGHIYPYTMSVPASLTLITFPDDPYDMYALAGRDPASNVLIGIDTKADPRETKSAYIRAWRKQFSVLTGVKSIDPFTNKMGLKGYKVKFLNAGGETPGLDIFFEVPDKPHYVIHLSNGPLDPGVFDQIVDSVGWEER